jgi:hypothetical protein
MDPDNSTTLEIHVHTMNEILTRENETGLGQDEEHAVR